MKNTIIVFVTILVTMNATSQVNPIIPNNVPKKKELPVPVVKTIKPDLTIEIERVSDASYKPATKKTTFKVFIIIKNNSDAPAAACKIAPYSYHHSSTNIDHVYWHVGSLIDIPSIPANSTLRRSLIITMDEMPDRTTPYPFKMEVDKSYIIDEADELNNDSNEVEVTVAKAL